MNFFSNRMICLNASKTDFIVFSKTKRTTNTHMVVDNKVIDEEEAIRYVGVNIDNLLTFQKETKHILKNGSRY